MKLNDLACKSAKPTEKPYKKTDGGGLFLLVNPNGSKLWRLKYRFLGKEKLLAIGKAIQLASQNNLNATNTQFFHLEHAAQIPHKND